jgi:RNA polymerase sigma factor (sigma-70 family)
MHAAADHELLRRYAEHGAEEAFNELVQRHLNLVWAAARRVSGNADLARDVAQTVFTDLARKAGTLPHETVLAGWLYRAACHAAAKQARGEARRVLREQHAMATQESTLPDSATAQATEELQPMLDAALAELSETDRDAVVLRFLAGRSLAEVGTALGTGEDAAQKRVSRALEKLREAFRRRGVNVGGGVMAAALGLAGAEAAPAGLAGGLTAAALAAAGTAGGPGATLLLMKTKLTLGIVGGAAVIAALTWQQHHLTGLTEENSALHRQLAANSAKPPPSATNNPAEPETLARLREQQEELLRLRGEVAELRRAAREARNRPAAAPDAGATQKVEPTDQAKAILFAEAAAILTVNAQKHLSLALHAYANEHQGQLPTTFEDLKPLLGGALDPDGTVVGIPLDLFEFHIHGRDVRISEPGLILLREKQARRLPDGAWERTYTLAGGSVRRIKRPDGNFSEFEQAGTGTPANAPKQP